MRRTLLQRLCGLGACTILALGVSACGDDDGGDAAGGGAAETTAAQERNLDFDVQVGDLVPLTGDLSAFGPPGRKAADLAVAQLEQAIEESGVGSQVSVSHADTETQSQAAVQAARQLVSGGSSCLAGAWASANTIPVGQTVASRQRVPLISPASTSAEITDLEDNGFVFRVAPSDILQAQALADVIEQEVGADATVSLAARNDAYGEGFIKRFAEAWEGRQGEVRGPVLYDPEQPSYNSEAARIVEGDPDAYVIIDFPETFQKMGAALVRTGDFDATKLFTADGLAADSVPEGIPQASLRGARGTRPAAPEEGQVVERFNELFTQADGPGRQTFDAQNFDAVMLCYLAAAAAGSSDGADIAEQLQAVSSPPGMKFNLLNLAEGLSALQRGEEVDFDGVTGPIDFDDNGDPSAATYEVWRYGEDDGELEAIRTFEARAQG